MVPRDAGAPTFRKDKRMAFFAYFRPVIAALVLLAMACAAPAWSQVLTPDGAPNPTASSVHEQTVLKEFSRAQGRIDIPDTQAAVLIQPDGRIWDYFHQVLLQWGAAAIILGTILLLAIAYLIMGPLRIQGGRSGQKILRFKAIERFSHWLTAVSFVILGLTGLNITFGKRLLQ